MYEVRLICEAASGSWKSDFGFEALSVIKRKSEKIKPKDIVIVDDSGRNVAKVHVIPKVLEKKKENSSTKKEGCFIF